MPGVNDGQLSNEEGIHSSVGQHIAAKVKQLTDKSSMWRELI